MLPTIKELLKKAHSLMEFLKKELLGEPPPPEKRALRIALRTVRGCQKELRRLRRMIQVDDVFVYRIHHRRRLDLREFRECVEKQKKKIDRIVVGMMMGYIVTMMEC